MICNYIWKNRVMCHAKTWPYFFDKEACKKFNKANLIVGIGSTWDRQGVDTHLARSSKGTWFTCGSINDARVCSESYAKNWISRHYSGKEYEDWMNTLFNETIEEE